MNSAEDCGRFAAIRALEGQFSMAPTCFLAAPPPKIINNEIHLVPSVDFYSAQSWHAGGLNLSRYCPAGREIELFQEHLPDLLAAAQLGATEDFVSESKFDNQAAARLSACVRENAKHRRTQYSIGAAEVPSAGSRPRAIHAFAVAAPPAPAAFELHIFLPGPPENYPKWLTEETIYLKILNAVQSFGGTSVTPTIREIYGWCEGRSLGTAGSLALDVTETAAYLRSFRGFQRELFANGSQDQFESLIGETIGPLSGHLMRIAHQVEYQWAIELSHVCSTAMSHIAGGPNGCATTIQSHARTEHRNILEGLLLPLMDTSATWLRWNPNATRLLPGTPPGARAIALALGGLHHQYVPRHVVRDLSRRMWAFSEVQKFVRLFWKYRRPIANSIWPLTAD